MKRTVLTTALALVAGLLCSTALTPAKAGEVQNYSPVTQQRLENPEPGNWLLYRRTYDAAKTVAAFSATLRQEVDLDQLREQLLAVVQETMQPTNVSLWLCQSPQGKRAGTSLSLGTQGSSSLEGKQRREVLSETTNGIEPAKLVKEEFYG